MNDISPLRLRLDHAVRDILLTLPAMGRVMLTATDGSATHERIGPVGSVAAPGAVLRLSGEAHDAEIDTGQIATVIADRSGSMRDKPMPRLEFRDAGDEVLFSIIGLEGLEPFDAALRDFAGTPVEPAAARPAGERGDVGEDDPGHRPFAAACSAGADVTIAFNREGLMQRWHGPITEVKPAMGFINVMQPDFHLHLRAGTVKGWRLRETGGTGDLVVWQAIDAEGRDTGLSVTGPSAALGAP